MSVCSESLLDWEHSWGVPINKNTLAYPPGGASSALSRPLLLPYSKSTHPTCAHRSVLAWMGAVPSGEALQSRNTPSWPDTCRKIEVICRVSEVEAPWQSKTWYPCGPTPCDDQRRVVASSSTCGCGVQQRAAAFNSTCGGAGPWQPCREQSPGVNKKRPVGGPLAQAPLRPPKASTWGRNS